MPPENLTPTTNPPPPPEIVPEIDMAASNSHSPLIAIIVTLLLIVIALAAYFLYRPMSLVQVTQTVGTVDTTEIKSEFDQAVLEDMESDFQDIDASASGL